MGIKTNEMTTTHIIVLIAFICINVYLIDKNKVVLNNLLKILFWILVPLLPLTLLIINLLS